MFGITPMNKHNSASEPKTALCSIDKSADTTALKVDERPFARALSLEPNNTYCNIRKEYQAPSTTPSTATPVTAGRSVIIPDSVSSSPTKLFKPGIPAAAIIKNTVKNPSLGNCVDIPPASSSSLKLGRRTNMQASSKNIATVVIP